MDLGTADALIWIVFAVSFMILEYLRNPEIGRFNGSIIPLTGPFNAPPFNASPGIYRIFVRQNSMINPEKCLDRRRV